jgi:hypothetical protein
VKLNMRCSIRFHLEVPGGATGNKSLQKSREKLEPWDIRWSDLCFLVQIGWR